MTPSKDDDARSAGDRETAARVRAQLDAVQSRLEGVRQNVGELSHAGAEAWRAVEPDVRRLLSEMRDVLDRAGDRFREARARGAEPAPDRAAAGALPPASPASGAADETTAGAPDDAAGRGYADRPTGDPDR